MSLSMNDIFSIHRSRQMLVVECLVFSINESVAVKYTNVPPPF